MRGEEVKELARRLAGRVEKFRPELVVYLQKGGATVGETIAGELALPAVGLDVSYPLSRPLERVPAPFRPVLWPAKELAYRLTTPRLEGPLPSEVKAARRLALVDDSASTGRTLELVLGELERVGVERRRVVVAVVRCGRWARRLVDHFEIGEPAIFSGR